MNRLFGLTSKELVAITLALALGVIALPGGWKLLWFGLIIGFAAIKQRQFIKSIYCEPGQSKDQSTHQ